MTDAGTADAGVVGVDAGSDAGVQGDAGSDVCTPLPTEACPMPVPTYAQLEPVFKRSCVACHSGADFTGPWPLTTYQNLVDWQDIVRSSVLTCDMPPSDSGFPITLEERVAIFNWARCGVPQ